MTNPELAKEMEGNFLKEKARETVASFDLESFFAEEGDFDAHMDTIAGYLDVVVIPFLIEDCENKYGASPSDPSLFYEEFRSILVSELDALRLGFNDRQQGILDKFIQEIKDFEFSV